MLVVAKDLQTHYEKALDSASIGRELRPHFRKWLRFYLDFCSKYGHSPRSKSSVPLFMAKLASKNQPEAKRNEASVAVTLYFKMADTAKANALSKSKSESDRGCSKGAQPGGESSVTAMRECAGDHAAWGNRRLTNSSDRFTADLSLREAGGSMPPSRDRIPVAAPIEGRGSSWLTQYEEMKWAAPSSLPFRFSRVTRLPLMKVVGKCHVLGWPEESVRRPPLPCFRAAVV